MNVRRKIKWYELLFAWHDSVLPSILPQLIIMLAIATSAVFTGGRILGDKIAISTAPFTLVGLTLAIFLAFRNNVSYDRYWEARKAWGSVLIHTRSLAGQLLAYTPARHGDYAPASYVSHLIAFTYALKHQLRDSDASADLLRHLPLQACADLEDVRFKPIAICTRIRVALGRLQQQRGISDITLSMLDAQLNGLEAAAGVCERICSTPIPFAYSVLLHRTVYLYCFLLPFGLVDVTGSFTPLVCVFVAYTLFALEAIADEIEDPFDETPNALALDAMVQTIERAVLEQCGKPLLEEIDRGQESMVA
jgi:putative membrane protein